MKPTAIQPPTLAHNNRLHAAVIEALRAAAPEALNTDEILDALWAAGFDGPAQNNIGKLMASAAARLVEARSVERIRRVIVPRTNSLGRVYRAPAWKLITKA